MMNWKDEIRKTIYRQLPKDKADTLDFEDSVELHKQIASEGTPIWERTAEAVRQELLAAAEEAKQEKRRGKKTKEFPDEPVESFNSSKPGNNPDKSSPDRSGSDNSGPVSRPDENDPKDDRSEDAKAFLFKENMRLEGLRSELARATKLLQQQADALKTEEERLQAQKELFEKEKEEFRREMKDLNEQIRTSRQKLTDDQKLFDKKYKVLEMGFAKLNADKKDFESQKRAFEYKKKFLQDAERFDPDDLTTQIPGGEEFLFFKGVSHPLAVKKRYKELIKIYHPDNSDGDKLILQRINLEYDRIRKIFR